MNMTVRDVAEGVIDVQITGRLDTPGVDAIETRLNAEVAGRACHAIVDLTHVDFVGSMGIRMLVALARAQAKRQHKLVLYGAQEQVREIFETVSLGSILPVVDDGAAALAAARG
jgi:anti-anti-sigma factor